MDKNFLVKEEGRDQREKHKAALHRLGYDDDNSSSTIQ